MFNKNNAMKTKLTLILIGAITIMLITQKSFTNPVAKPINVADNVSIAHGKKIVLGFCAGCHGSDDGKLGGKNMDDIPSFIGKIHASNITQDKTNGIGLYTREELIKLLRTGIKRNGNKAFPMMPRFPIMADSDIEAIIDFLMSDDFAVQPSPNHFGEQELKMIARKYDKSVKPLDMPANAIALPDSSNKVVYGKYLATAVYRCWECHTKTMKLNDITPETMKGYLAGGFKMGMPDQRAITSNITPDKETGIGNWTIDDFKKLMKTGVRKNGKQARFPMIPLTYLSEHEVSCIWEYLQTVPPLKHKVKDL